MTAGTVTFRSQSLRGKDATFDPYLVYVPPSLQLRGVEEVDDNAVFSSSPPPSRAQLEAEWLIITRQTLPALAKTRRWPVSADHCFMRILLDAVHGDRWDNMVKGRPAYKHIEWVQLVAAVALAERVVANEADLWALNAQSLVWRGKGPKL